MLVGLQRAGDDSTGAKDERLNQHQPHQPGCQSHLLRVGFYVSPILYGLDTVQERFTQGALAGHALSSWLPTLYILNPFAILLTGYREAFFFGGFLAPALWALLFTEAALVLGLGYQAYQYFDRRVIKFL